MSTMKTRLLGLAIIAMAIAMQWYNLYELREKGTYHFKAAAFAPLLFIGGLYSILFPSLAGKPETAKQKVLLIVVFVVGLATGAVDVYFMDPGFFGF
ncbi:MAG: hypothetical protein JFAIHJKO_00371 [Pyrinomonadaceae bacterium]|nr:hypothetical protein [Pyrinomonadaceae bacterium]